MESRNETDANDFADAQVAEDVDGIFQLPEFEEIAISETPEDVEGSPSKNSTESCDWRSEVLKLFDTGTVAGQMLQKTRIKATVIKKPKVVLIDGGKRVEVTEESYLSFCEVPSQLEDTSGTDVVDTSLNLNILRGCDRDAEGLPVMPSLRLETLRKGYFEPTRDRDKDWQLDSQREVLNKSNMEGISLPPLPMGKYDPEKRAAAPLLWSPAMQALVRKKLLSRIPYVISETSCFIDVYGLGINGRVYSEGSATNRLLVLNVYSVWNSEMHTMTLSGAQLRSLFASRRDVLKAGLRPELLHELISMLYFQYFVVVTPEPGDEDFGTVRERIYEARHLDSPKLPFDFPQSIEEVIRELCLAEGVGVNAKCPTALRQELRIAFERQETAREKHLRDAAERARREAEEAERERLAWLAIPKRKRGLEATRPFRMWGRMVVLTAYRVPQKPIITTVTGYFPNNSFETEVILSMKATGALYGVAGNVRNWPHPVIRSLLRKAVKDVKLRNVGFEDFFSLNLFSVNGPSVSLPDLPDCGPSFLGSVRHVKERERNLRLDYLRANYSAIGGPFDGYSRACSHLRSTYLNLPTREPTHYRVIRSRASGLSATSTRINPRTMNELQWTDTEENMIRDLKLAAEKSGEDISASDEDYVEAECEALRKDIPRRMDVGRGLRVASRVKKIGNTYCIYTMYLDKIYPGFPPHTWEEDKDHLQPLDIRSRKTVSAFAKKRPKKVQEEVPEKVDVPQSTEDDEDEEEEEDEFRFSEDEEEEEEEPEEEEVDALEQMRRDMGKGAANNLGQNSTTDLSDVTDTGNGQKRSSVSSQRRGSGAAAVAAPEEVDPYDNENQLFETVAPDVSISIDIFLPYGAELEGYALPEASKLRLELTKEDIYRAVTKHKHLIYVGFRAAYTGFYSRASDEETSEVERAWSLIAEEIMEGCRWTVRRPIIPKPILEDDSDDALQRYNAAVLQRNAQLMMYLCSMDTVDVTNEKYGIKHRPDYDPDLQSIINSNVSIESIRKAERKARGLVDSDEEDQEDLAFMKEIEQLESEFSEQATLASLAASSLAMKSAESAEKPTIPDIPTVEEPRLVLTWPTVVFRRVVRVQSVVEGETDPLIQVTVWQKDKRMGVIGVNRKRKEIMFAQAAEAQQAAQVQSNRFLSVSERAVGIFIYLTIELCYSVVMESQTGRAHGSLELVQAEDQSFTFEVAEEDLLDLTADVMKVGGNKMRRSSRS